MKNIFDVIFLAEVKTMIRPQNHDSFLPSRTGIKRVEDAPQLSISKGTTIYNKTNTNFKRKNKTI